MRVRPSRFWILQGCRTVYEERAWLVEAFSRLESESKESRVIVVAVRVCARCNATSDNSVISVAKSIVLLENSKDFAAHDPCS